MRYAKDISQRHIFVTRFLLPKILKVCDFMCLIFNKCLISIDQLLLSPAYVIPKLLDRVRFHNIITIEAILQLVCFLMMKF